MPDPGEVSWPGARALVVDDDTSVREYVRTLLTRLKINVDTAVDGAEAEEKLRATQYHLLFLDLDLPRFSGRFLLELIKRGKAHRPLWIVVMSGAPNIAMKVGDDWTRLGVTDFLAKPFSAADVQAFLDRTLEMVRAQVAGRTPVRTVLVAGSGAWAGALLRLVRRSGGTPNAAQTAEEVAAMIKDRPGVFIIGPPFDDAHIVQTCVRVRDSLPMAEVLVATDRQDATSLRADLLRIGVVRTIELPAGLSWLAGEMVRVAGLQPRMARAPLAKSILVRGSNAILAAEAIELFETGLSVKVPPGTALPAPPLLAEFEIPGEDRLIEIPVDTDFSQATPTGVQVGFKFLGMQDADLERVRNYLLINDPD